MNECQETASVVSGRVSRIDEVQVRLDCLRLVINSVRHVPSHDPLVIETARRFADFVLGTSDADVIGAAREFATVLSSARA